jgi:protein arginine kinase activator
MREARVHWSGEREGARTQLWLCSACAAYAGESAVTGAVKPDAVDAFLVEDLTGAADTTCPECGWTSARFRATNRLGCPACYQAFRSLLMPLLGRLHRHVSHLGRAPRQGGAEPGRLAQITRTRAALEKAVAAENFEEAARLRDRVRSLEQTLPPEETT